MALGSSANATVGKPSGSLRRPVTHAERGTRPDVTGLSGARSQAGAGPDTAARVPKNKGRGPPGPGPRRRPGPGVRPGGSEGRERYQAQGERSLQRGPQRERACCGGRRTGSGLFAPQQSLKQNLSSPGHAAPRPVLRRVPPGRARARMRPVCLASSCARARPRGHGTEASRRPSVRRLKAGRR